MGLLKPKWKHKNRDKRAEAVRKLKDQELLADIAKNDEDVNVRKVAIRKLNDKIQLLSIAKNEKHWSVRKTAILTITESKNLREAIEKIVDQELLVDIVKNDKGDTVRSESIKKLDPAKYQDLLIGIAGNDKSLYIRNIALQKLGKFTTDKSVELLISMLKDNNNEIRKKAIDILGEIQSKKAINHLIKILNEDYSDVRVSAIKALGNIGDIRAAKWIIDKLFSKHWCWDGAIPIALNALDKLDKDWVVRQDVIEAVPRIIKNKLESNYQMDAIQILSRIGNKKAVKSIADILKDDLRLKDFNFVKSVASILVTSNSYNFLDDMEKAICMIILEYWKNLNNLNSNDVANAFLKYMRSLSLIHVPREYDVEKIEKKINKILNGFFNFLMLNIAEINKDIIKAVSIIKLEITYGVEDDSELVEPLGRYIISQCSKLNEIAIKELENR